MEPLVEILRDTCSSLFGMLPSGMGINQMSVSFHVCSPLGRISNLHFISWIKYDLIEKMCVLLDKPPVSPCTARVVFVVLVQG
jgi:hypothetical protein